MHGSGLRGWVFEPHILAEIPPPPPPPLPSFGNGNFQFRCGKLPTFCRKKVSASTPKTICDVNTLTLYTIKKCQQSLTYSYSCERKWEVWRFPSAVTSMEKKEVELINASPSPQHTHTHMQTLRHSLGTLCFNCFHFHIFCLSTRDVLFLDPFLPALLFSFQRRSLHSPLFFKRAHPCPHLSFVWALLLLLFSFERWPLHSPLFFKLAHPCPHLSFVLVAFLLFFLVFFKLANPCPHLSFVLVAFLLLLFLFVFKREKGLAKS